MTFVRAVLSARGPSIYADWQVGHPKSTRPAGYMDGTLKALILGRGTCVAYAGNIELALRGVRESQGAFTCGEVERGLEVLASWAQSGDCEFLVGLRSPASLYEIKSERPRRCNAAWIGNHHAFEQFQSEIAAARADGTDDRVVVSRAFDRVITKGLVAGVGVVSVGVEPTADRLVYLPRAGAVAGSTIQTVRPGNSEALTFGNAEDGGFAYSQFGATDHAAVGMYFPHGNFGIVSAPLLLAQTERARGAAQAEFIENVLMRFGIALGPGPEWV